MDLADEERNVAYETDEEVLSGERLGVLLAGLGQVQEEIAKHLIGYESVTRQLLVALMAGGHVLIEGAPGLGKTLAVRMLAQACGMRLSRVQFTPDLMPADITGTIILIHQEDGRPTSRFMPGPVFANIVLADEINRATPRTQSALLEAMQEGTVTVAGDGHLLPAPFFVLATQNPIDQAGTYPLPEAQVDRFLLKVLVDFPPAEVLDKILEQTTSVATEAPQARLEPADIVELQKYARGVRLASHVRRAVVEFVQSTQPAYSSARSEVQAHVRYGVTPRGAQAFVLAAKAAALLGGRFNVSLEDLREVLLPALRHRIHLTYRALSEGVKPEELLISLFEESTRRRTWSA